MGSNIKKFACGALFLEMTKILSKMVLSTRKIAVVVPRKKKRGERKEKKGKGKKRVRKKGRGEKTVYKISGSEPSEREARTTCERMTKKSATSHKVPAPALYTSKTLKIELSCTNIHLL